MMHTVFISTDLNPCRIPLASAFSHRGFRSESSAKRGHGHDPPGKIRVFGDESEFVVRQGFLGVDVGVAHQLQDVVRFLVVVELDLQLAVDIAESLDAAVLARRDLPAGVDDLRLAPSQLDRKSVV